jgi:hypothetical protein
MPRPNLEAAALDCIADAIYGVGTLDLDALRDGAQEQASNAADNACTYHSDCLEIINRYEREAPDAEDMTGGATYKAADWQQAMCAYAYAVAYTVISQDVNNLIDDIEQTAADLRDTAEGYGLEDPADPRVTADCPHGWAAHDREDEAGTHFWTEGNLEGCRAVARKVAGVWLSYTWTPEEAEEEGGE